ncbi:hypothetical protein [Serinicoccus kebangsaanensis]|uniref:hypothetical protein n=1 Tax=Serinicoccus kebangsaanensis TaxID=2602069 RepID=UPI00124C3191|nr:hypothetical protein [Serinicoccus kebangsaanensis]
MVVFALILLIVAAAVVVYMWLATRGMDPIAISYGVLNVEITPIWLFTVGGITLAAATCGLWLLAVGTRAKARRAREVRDLRRQAKDSDRRAERDRDAARLGQSSSGGSATTSGSTDRPAASTSTQDGPLLPRTGSRGQGGAAGAGPGGQSPDHG